VIVPFLENYTRGKKMNRPRITIDYMNSPSVAPVLPLLAEIIALKIKKVGEIDKEIKYIKLLLSNDHCVHSSRKHTAKIWQLKQVKKELLKNLNNHNVPYYLEHR
jgi:hypothetical protein